VTRSSSEHGFRLYMPGRVYQYDVALRFYFGAPGVLLYGDARKVGNFLPQSGEAIE